MPPEAAKDQVMEEDCILVSDKYAVASEAPVLSSSCFLGLPQEIRDEIYAYCLTAPQGRISWPARSPMNHVTSGLLASCRQIHKEAGPILYNKNIFVFNHPSDLNVFRHIMDRHSREMCRVELRLRERDLRMWTSYFSSTHATRSLITDLPNLTNLDIHLRHNAWSFGVDLEEAMRTWHNNKPLKHLCLSLEGKTPEHAQTTVIMSMRTGEPQLDYLRRNMPEAFKVLTADYARTNLIEMRAQTYASLELVSSKTNAWL